MRQERMPCSKGIFECTSSSTGLKSGRIKDMKEQRDMYKTKESAVKLVESDVKLAESEAELAESEANACLQ
jgi:hypothetical protein